MFIQLSIDKDEILLKFNPCSLCNPCRSCNACICYVLNVISDNAIVKFYDEMNIKKYLINLFTAGKPQQPTSSNLCMLIRYIGQYAVFAILYGCSLVYQSLVQLRLYLYQQDVLKRTVLPCPVISIGNITTGGTGKTPMVIRMAQILRQQGKRVVILSRGYRRQSLSGRDKHEAKTFSLVSPSSDVRLVGDEPLLISRKLQIPSDAPVGRDCAPAETPDVIVIVGRQRSLSGQFAVKQFQPGVILLDDGLQHVQLERTCDIVLIDATNPFGGGYLLPAGLLREPLRNLARAQAFVITRSDEVADITPIREQLHALNPQAPIFIAQHRFDGIRDATTGESIELTALTQQRLLTVSGLGNPASFHQLLSEIGLIPAHTLDFPDHQWYTTQDIDTINRILRERKLAEIVTTEKDEIKLLQHADRLNAPVYTVTITMHVEPEAEFETFVRERSVPFSNPL
jgi:tetraacyldisaccharide 4'-kinase